MQPAVEVQAQAVHYASGPERFRWLIHEVISEYEKLSHGPQDESGTGSREAIRVAGESHPHQQHEQEDNNKAIDAWATLTTRLLEPKTTVEMRPCWEGRTKMESYSRASTTMAISRAMSIVKDSAVQDDVVMDVHKKRIRRGNTDKLTAGTRYMQLRFRHPDSILHMTWSAIGLCLLGLNAFFVSMIPFYLQTPPTLEIIDCLYWSCDLVARFFVGVRTANGISFRFQDTARQYLSTWFFFDIIILMGQWLMWIFFQGEGLVANAVRFVRYIRLLRVAKFQVLCGNLFVLVGSAWLKFFIRICGFLLGMVCWIHCTGCMFYWIGNTPRGWVAYLEDNADWPASYFCSIHWATSQLQGSMANYPTLSVRERAFVVVHACGSIVVLAMVVSKVINVMREMQEIHAQRKRMLQVVQQLLDRHSVSTELRLRLARHVVHSQKLKWQQHRQQEEDSIVEGLPFQIRKCVLQECRWPSLRKHTIFRAMKVANRNFTEAMMHDVLQNVLFVPDDIIFGGGKACKTVHLLLEGSAIYMRWSGLMDMARLVRCSGGGESDGLAERYRAIHERDVMPDMLLCESAFWVEWVHRGGCDARTLVTALAIDVAAFVELVGTFHSVARALRIHARRFVEELTMHGDSADDLFCTSEVVRSAKRPSSDVDDKGPARPVSFRASLPLQVSEHSSVGSPEEMDDTCSLRQASAIFPTRSLRRFSDFVGGATRPRQESHWT